MDYLDLPGFTHLITLGESQGNWVASISIYPDKRSMRNDVSGLLTVEDARAIIEFLQRQVDKV